ncbi:hypothetical protein AKO1_000684, partial [Acrasis kona]
MVHGVLPVLIVLVLSLCHNGGCLEPWKNNIDIVGYWKLFNSTEDSGPYKYNMAVGGGASFSDANGRGGLEVRGAAATVNNPSKLSTAFTFAMWVYFYPFSTSNEYNLIKTSSGYAAIGYKYTSGTAVNFLPSIRAGYVNQGTTRSGGNVNNWVHVALTTNAKDVTFYVNGDVDITLTLTASYNQNFQNLVLTSGPNTGNVTAIFEHVVAATRALSAWEVRALRDKKLFCFGTGPSNLDNCVNGVCSSLDYCSCNPNWYGDTCNLTLCNGIISSSTSVCSSGGRCSNFDTCVCDNYRAGQFCEFDYSLKYNITTSTPKIIKYDSRSDIDIFMNVTTPFSLDPTLARNATFKITQGRPSDQRQIPVTYINNNTFQLGVNFTNTSTQFSFTFQFNNIDITDPITTFITPTNETEIACKLGNRISSTTCNEAWAYLKGYDNLSDDIGCSYSPVQICVDLCVKDWNCVAVVEVPPYTKWGDLAGCCYKNKISNLTKSTVNLWVLPRVLSTPTPTLTPTPTPTPTYTPSQTLTPSPTLTSTPTPTSSPTLTPTSTPTINPTSTSIPTSLPTPTMPAVVHTFAQTPTFTPSPTPTEIFSPSRRQTPTPTPTQTPTATTRTATITPTSTPTRITTFVSSPTPTLTTTTPVSLSPSVIKIYAAIITPSTSGNTDLLPPVVSASSAMLFSSPQVNSSISCSFQDSESISPTVVVQQAEISFVVSVLQKPALLRLNFLSEENVIIAFVDVSVEGAAKYNVNVLSAYRTLSNL